MTDEIPLARVHPERPVDGQDLPRPALSPSDPPPLRQDEQLLAGVYAAAFEEWRRRYDADPASFDYGTATTYGARCAVHFMRLLAELAQGKPESPVI